MKTYWASALSLATGALAATSNSTASNSTIVNALLANGNVDLGIAQEAYLKAKTFVAGLNITQKTDIVKGTTFTSDNGSWTGYSETNGVAGLNFYYFVSAFPMANAVTMTWNRSSIAAHFKAVGDEMAGTGNNLVDGAVLGPLGRVAEGGRSNEAFSPDPYLSGILVATGVKAQNDAGVVAGVRHFLLYEQETNRMGGGGGGGGSAGSSSGGGGGFQGSGNSSNSSSTLSKRATSIIYSSNADDKTIHELYLAPWADAVQAGAMAVMCAMPYVNNTRSCESNDLLSGLLKTELGFPGFVYPDISSQVTSYGSANAGLDFSTTSGELWSETIFEEGIANGSMSEKRLDDMAIRTVLPYYFVGLDTEDLTKDSSYTSFRNIRGNHSALIRQIGGESIALLKNNVANGGGLPLKAPETISLFGAHAGPATAGPNYGWGVQGTSADVFQGHLANGGGSSQLSLPYLITPFQALTDQAVEDNSMIWWIMNNTYTSTSSGGVAGIGGGTGDSPDIATYAENSAVCLVFINNWSGEGADRSELYNEEQDTLVTTVASSCNNTVVVANVAGPRIVEAWIEHENVTAVLYSGLLGQESGHAIRDVLYGDVNPSGKLIFTIAKNGSDYPAAVCETADCDFTEGVYIDYRWFDEQTIEPRFPFGHGLSYTTFEYGTASATITNTTALSYTYANGALGLGGKADMWNDVIVVNTTIQNTGDVAGAEVAQLYVSFPDAANQPIRSLKGFEKVAIAAGATESVSFTLRRRDISYWDVKAQNWAVASGEYTLSVGSSSRDLRANTTLTITI